MSFKFNPLTGTLDYFESQTATYNSDEKTVDATFLIDKKLALSNSPVFKSELIFLNGLLLGRDCYIIVANEITFEPTLPFKVGHYIDVRYTV